MLPLSLSSSKTPLPPANEVCEGYAFTGVCLSTGGVCPIACWDPPQADTPQQVHPPGQTPPRQVHPPGQVHPRQVHPPAGTPLRQVHTPGQVHPLAGTPLWAGTPLGRYTPGQVHPLLGRYTPWVGTPPAQCMLEYGQQAGGTHPTGMHSCFNFC